MTEIEAWQFIADWFVPENCTHEGWYLRNGIFAKGICSLITVLRMTGNISNTIELSMSSEIRNKQRELGFTRYAYIAPLDAEGAKIRRQFCLDQVERLKAQ
jgi:hypothetical protein